MVAATKKIPGIIIGLVCHQKKTTLMRIPLKIVTEVSRTWKEILYMW